MSVTGTGSDILLGTQANNLGASAPVLSGNVHDVSIRNTNASAAMADLSGIVPVAVVMTGPILAGPALILGLADVVVMTPEATAYVVGPDTVEAITGQRLTVTDLDRITRYEALLHPWIDRPMDTIISIRTDIITGYRLITTPC